VSAPTPSSYPLGSTSPRAEARAQNGYAWGRLPSLDPHFHGTSRFRIVSRLAVGTVGEVYKVVDEQRGAFVALRTLRNVPSNLGHALERDFRALKAVRHPALVSLDELMREGGVWFYTMELVEGESLVDYVRPRFGDAHESVAARTRSLSEVRLRSALAQLVRGLSALHEAGRVHGNLEPDHVRVTAQGRVVLLESELLGRHQGIDTQQRLLGALPYVAPERLEDAPSSSATDWYAVGALLFQALSGVAPFSGSGADLLDQKQTVVPELGPERSVPADLAQLCRALLAIDPDARPDTDEVRSALGIGRDPDTRVSQTFSPVADAPPFIGRRRDLSLLVETFERTRHGAVSTLCVYGPTGVGKRALVAQLTRRLRSEYPQLVHLWGRAEPEGSRALRGIGQAMDALARYLLTLDQSSVATLLPPDASAIARMFPSFAPIVGQAQSDDEQHDPRALRRSSVRAMRALIRNLSKRHPLVVVLEDMHAADVDGLYLLEALIRPPQAPDMLLVFTAQGDVRDAPEAFSGFLARCREQITQMPMRALANDGVRELSERLLAASGVHDAALAQRIAGDAQGLPLRVDALVRHYLSGGVVPREGLPLSALLWARIEQLPLEARLMVTALGFARTPLTLDQLARVIDLSGEDVQRLASSLRREGLLRGTRELPAERWGLNHPALAEAVRANARVQAELMHARIARAIDGDLETSDVAANHLLAAGQQVGAAHAAERAARRARDRLMLDAAVELYQQAVALAELPPDAAVRLRTELAHAYAHAGQSERAATAYVDAARLSSPEQALELERAAAQQLLRVGHVSSGLSMIEGILAQLAVRLPGSKSSAMVSLFFRRARLSMRGLGFRERRATALPASDLAQTDVLGALALSLAMIDVLRGADVQTRHLLLALRLGDPVRVARALALEAGIEASLSVPGAPRYRATMARCEELVEQTGDAQAAGILLSVKATTAFFEGRYREHVQLSFEAERRLGLAGAHFDWEIGRTRVFRAMARTLLGELKANSEAVGEQIREARERGDRYTEVHLTLSCGYLAQLYADDPRGAMAMLQEGLAAWEQESFHMHSLMHLRGMVEAEVYARKGRPYARVMAAWPELSRSSLLRIPYAATTMQHLRAVAAIAEANEDLRDRELMLADAADCGNKLIAVRSPAVAGFGYAVRAGVSAMRGERGLAIQRLELAEAAFYEGEVTLYAAATRFQLGRLQGGARGQELASRAHEWLRDQGVRRPSAFVNVLLPGFE
jgi:eukaryotic-like serine/threonine-protein kinase